jgi:hypothetical protein
MKTIIWVIALPFCIGLGVIEHLVLCLAAIPALLGLGSVLAALHNAPEGYEDDDGFHTKQRSHRIGHSARLGILRPYNAS